MTALGFEAAPSAGDTAADGAPASGATAEGDRLLVAPRVWHDSSPQCVHGEPVLGGSVELRVSTSPDVQALHLRYVVDGDPYHVAATRQGGADDGWQAWTCDLPVGNPTVNYRFLLRSGDVGWTANTTGVVGHECTDDGDWRVTIDPGAPDWVVDGLVYQIFPDRFYAGSQPVRPESLPAWAIPASWNDPVAHGTPEGVRQWYGGTLWGIAERLPALARFGVTVLYLTPFFPGDSNHRYDATTFDHVDPLLGGDDALRHLTAEAEKVGIHVIGDLTLNHTGSGHEWFRSAQQDPDGPEGDFYFFGPGRTTWEGFFGLPSMPRLNHASPELRRRLYDGPDSVVARYVRDFGLHGWRIDVAQSAGVHGADDFRQEVARLTRRTLDATRPGSYLVAEMQHDARGFVNGGGWQGVMGYASFTRPVWNWLVPGGIDRQWGAPVDFAPQPASVMEQVMESFAGGIPWPMRAGTLNLIDSHDTARLRSMGGPQGRRIQHLAAVLQFTLPGTPMIYSGDERGLEGVGLEDSRRPYPLTREEGDAGTLDHYRTLVELRRSLPVLRRGSLRWLASDPAAALFVRELDAERVLVHVRRHGDAPAAAPVDVVSVLDARLRVAAGEELPGDWGVWACQRAVP